MMHKLISYYGFSRMPFGRDLAPGMLHRHSAHNEAVARIGWCIADRRIGVITGEVGAGKTVAVRAALASLDRSRHTIIYLPDPTVGVQGIHHRIVASLGGQPLTHHATLAPQAADALAAEQAERGRTPVVVVEEAHLLGYDQLEALRLLTNHDLDSSSPFACLLIGQPTLRRRMKLGVLAALDQRIGLRYAMPPMTDTNTGSYLRHHLKLAGRDDALFSDDAIGLIHQTSRGYPRAVNNLALQALVAAFAADKAIVEKTAAEFASQGVPEDLAYRVSTGLYRYSLLDIIDIADIADIDAAEVADTYFALMDRLGTDGLLTAVSQLPRHDRWHSLARLAIRDDIYGALRSLCFDVLAVGEPGESSEQKIAEWEHLSASRVARARRTLDDIRASGQKDLATLSVAARQIRRMTRTSGRGISG